jgi:exodeoxyribonuclease-3
LQSWLTRNHRWSPDRSKLPDSATRRRLLAGDQDAPERFPEKAGYGVIWHGQKSYNGVAILARGRDPVETHRGLPGDPEDLHSRYLEATVDDLTVGCLYLPNGNPAPGPKFDYKLRWLERLTLRAAELVKRKSPVILAGDYNVIPTEIDVYKPERWVDDALFRLESRTAYRQLLEQSWTDAIRHLYPHESIYTFWDFFRNAYGRDAGLRIDHLLLNPALAPRLKKAGVDREIRGWEKTSDHAPT